MRKVVWMISIALGLGWGSGCDDLGTTPGSSTTPTAGGGAGTQAIGTAGATAGVSGVTMGTAGRSPDVGGRSGTGASGIGAPTAGTAAGTGTSGTGAAATAGSTAPTAGTGAATAGTGAAPGGMGAVAGTSGGPAAASGSCGPPADTVDMAMGPGPWKPMHVERTGPNGSSWVFFPEGLGKDGLKHPVFNWGPGAGTSASNYVDHLNHLASHGFVVISQPSTQSGKQALDWLLAENDKQGSMFYQKLDTMRVGRGGHSMGSLQTMSEADDPRLTLYVLVCGGCMSGRGGCGAADIHAPTVILGGDRDNPGTPNYEGDFAEIKSPVVFVTKTGTDHIQCARNNMAPWTAFMRMTWCGEEAKYKPDFMMGGTYCKSPWQDCKSKMF
jgi:hypothetical protein